MLTLVPARRRPLGISADDLDVVMRAARVFSSVVASSVAQVDDLVTSPQLRVLVLVATREEVTASVVAAALDVHLSSASRLCDRLVMSGFLERTTSLTDRRNILLSLTAEGSRLLGRIMEHRRQTFAGILTQMAEADRQSLNRCLTVFADAAGEPPETSLRLL